MRSSLLLALTLCMATASDAVAQTDLPALQSGIRVRIDHTCPGSDRAATNTCRSEGLLTELARDTVVLDVDETGRAGFGLNTVRQFEINLGPRGHPRLGAVVGLLGGLGIAHRTVYGGGADSRCDGLSNPDAASPSTCMGWITLAGLAAGGLGALIGELIRTERWQDIPVYQLRPRPVGGAGFSLGFAIRP